MDNERSALITIGGEEYEMLLTTKATKEIAGRYGGRAGLGGGGRGDQGRGQGEDQGQAHGRLRIEKPHHATGVIPHNAVATT